MNENAKVLAVIGAGLLIMGLAKGGTIPPPPPGKANLSGRVTDSTTGAGLAGVQVSLDGLSTVTDTSGHYLFTDLEPGAYTIVFSKGGYHDYAG